MSQFSIDKKWLIHEIEIISSSNDGDGPVETTQVINNVLFQNQEHMITTAAGDSITSAGVLYWDVLHSDHYDFKINDVFRFQGVEYVIQKIIPRYTFELNHKEIHVQ